MLDPSVASVAVRLSEIVGEAHVSNDPAALALHSHDLWAEAPSNAELIVSPGSLEEVSQIARIATSSGSPISLRGAGVSYTSSYLPAGAQTISLDLSRMDRILAIDADNMVVTVEAGCRWAALHAALQPLGLRTPFWGPMSGLKSTIGGGLSNLNAMFGAARYGTTSESVIAATIVLADGRILRTGARNASGIPFYRHYGPDLLGLFAGDGGAFGIKAEITLRLMRAPSAEAYASFEFATGRDLIAAMAEIGRAGIACETCAFDPALARIRMVRASMSEDVRMLSKLVRQEHSLIGRLRTLVRVPLAGRNFLDPSRYSLHVICEGRARAAVDADIAELRRISSHTGGKEIENSIARVIRANPFPPLNSILGPGGERWAPVHGIAALADAAVVFASVQSALAEESQSMERHGITTATLFTNLSTNALIVEPVFYWPEHRFALHEATMEPAHLARLPVLPANPEATSVVTKLRQKLIDVFAAHGCAHFQIGRAYPYRASRDTASVTLLELIKRTTDPRGLLNPGGLGISTPMT